jgi:ABC-type transport system involved in multi-copper enzyme maturation permease subunit
MKLLAILRDSLREAIDSKVFYVMIGLSVVVTLLASTTTFKPRPAQEIMQIATVFLTLDESEMNDPDRLLARGRSGTLDFYEVVGVSPREGETDAPSSHFTVLLRAPKARPDAEKEKPEPKKPAEELIKERFGAMQEFRFLAVDEVKSIQANDPRLPEPHDLEAAYYEVKTSPTAATLRMWPHEFSLFFGGLPLLSTERVPLGYQLFLIEDFVIAGIGAWVIILVSIVITAFFIPNMLRKGTVDLLVVKPIRRWALLLYKYVGGLTFIFLNTCVAVIGVWLALSLRSGVWATGFLWTIPAITFFFAILYAFSTLFSVLTRSPIATILLTCAVWFLIWVTGFVYSIVDVFHRQEELKNGPVAASQAEGAFAKTVRVVHFVMPRAKDLDHLMSRLLVTDLLTANQIKSQKMDSTPISWGESVTVSCVYITALLCMSCFWFATRDY